jgi:Fic family protein
MDPATFTNPASGDIVQIVEGDLASFAFIPAPLPVAAPVLTPEVAMACSEADAELGRLDGLAAYLPDPEILIGPFLRREAILSSRIEGTRTTFSDLVLFEATEERETSGDTREVSNYIDALKYGVRRVQEIPFGRQLVYEIHELLMSGSEPEKLPGRFRNRQVFIAPVGLSILDARYVPPPVYAIDPAFENLVAYHEQPDRLPLLIRLAISHYQFEAIHPFIDGNGRMGRLLIVLMLCQTKRLAAPMLYLSAYFERRRVQYNDLMLGVSQAGRWEPWLQFFLNGVAAQARDAVVRTRQLHALRDTYRKRVTGARRSTSAVTLVDALFGFPVMTTRIARRILNMSDTAALENILKLVDAGILRQVSPATGRLMLFIADEITDIIDRAEAIPATQKVGLPSAAAIQKPEAVTQSA